MKTIVKTLLALAFCCGSVMAQGSMAPPENPATGIWIQQVGDIVPHASTKATLYYTKYSQNDRVKDLNYYYDGAGYLQLLSKETLCTSNDGMKGADGIVHHPDGDLLVAAQGQNIHKISKTAKKDGTNGGKCVVKTATPATSTEGFWHLMMDPNQEWLWAAGIPGYLYRFSTKIDSNNVAARNFADKGHRVELVPKSTDRVQNKKLATLIWDKDGNAFFTYSNYFGGGCEANAKGDTCSEASQKSRRAGAYFGYITDTTWTKVTEQNKDSIGGTPGDSVITKLGTTILIDSLEGAHGGTYDPYSETIFVFGGARIVQIRPFKEGGKMKAEVVAFIDLRHYFFVEDTTHLTLPRTYDGGYVGWRLDQGTVDGMGHLFVASNTGHLVFVDYAANPNKKINDNVLVHVQWIDNFLDDLAPLSGAGVVRTGANTGSDVEVSSSSIGFSSSRVVYEESSSSVKSSSSSRPGSSSSSRPASSSSGNNPGTSSSGNNPGTSSSGNNPGTSSSGDNPGTSSSGNNPGTSSSGDNPGSSGNNPGTSSSGDNPGSSGNNPGTSSSGDNPGSSGNNPGTSSSGNNPGSSGGNSGSSSSNKGGSEDINFGSSSSRVYVGFEDFDVSSSGGGIDFYPSDDKFEKGDSIVTSATILLPVDSAGGAGIIKIGENYYMEQNNPVALPLDLRVNSGLDSAQVGQVVALTLDPDKVKEYFGDVDSLTFATASGLTLIDPTNPAANDTIRVNADGSVTIWVTADSVVHGGSIIVHDPGTGTTVIIDNINFYDPIPDAELGYIKDSDGDHALDYVEIVLKDSVISDLEVTSVVLVVKGDTLKPKAKPTLNGTRDRITLDVADLDFPEKFPEDAYAVITYTNVHDDIAYTRDAYIVEVGSRVIKDAFAIRDVHGKDSLFIEFNIDLIPKDLSTPEMLVLLKQEGERYGFNLDQISNIYMPTRNMVILVGENMGLKGENRDSVSLHPGVQFNNLKYLTSDEYDREVVISVVDRLPSVVDVEYRDTDGDGTLDQIVTNFSGPLTETEKNMLYATFPWYSERGMMIQLQANPADLKFDGKDSSRVVWNVVSTTPLAKGVTSISESLPQATIYSYYDVLGQTFVSEESAPLVDKMSPIVSAVTLSYGQKADTLIVFFSEVIKYKDLEGRDFFSYIHGKDTIDILPKDIDWASDGMSAKLIIDGSVSTILPGDSLMVVRGEKSVIQDNFGNIAGDDPSPVVIAGLLNHLVDATNMGTFDGEDDVLQTLSSVNLRYMPGSTTKEDLEKEGALGQLVQLGERFVPQLLDRAQISADGTVDPSVLDSLDPEKVFITFVVNYYDHLGQYVNDTTILVPCNSPKFGGNCLVSDKKLFVNWNFKDHRGRFVGTGVYTVQFKMVVRYEKKKIEEEIKDKWGVRRKKRK